VFTHPQTVIYPSTNRAQCRLTTLIKANALTSSQKNQTNHEGTALFHWFQRKPSIGLVYCAIIIVT